MSFRYLKQFSNDGRELTRERAQNLAPYDLFGLYIDLLVDTADKRRHKIVGFSIAEEPLLQGVFSGEQKTTTNFIGLGVVLPDPALLMEMKINSFPDRTHDDKKTKDLADICALLLYSEVKPPILSDSKERIVRKARFRSSIASLTELEWDGVGRLLDENKQELKRIVAGIYT